jgi:hypothetical protein
MADLVCLTQKQVYVIITGVEKLKGWLDYSKNIVSCLQDDNLKLTRENEQLKKQIRADQYGQIFRIEREQKQLTL